VRPFTDGAPDPPRGPLSPELVLVDPDLARAAMSQPRRGFPRSLTGAKPGFAGIRAPSDAGASGERIASARRECGLTQRQLAAALGLSVWQLDRIESGDRDSSAHLPLVAEVAGRDEEWFRVAETRSAAGPTPPKAVARTGLVDGGRLLVLAAITLLVTIRFFTEVVPIIPRAANFVDVPILVVLGVAALLDAPLPKPRPRWYMPLGTIAASFLGLAAVSAIVNSGRTEPGPVLAFVYGFLAPLGLYAAVYRLWPSGNARALSRTIIALGVLQLVVVVLVDIPTFLETRNPDDVGGTFGTNAYQLVYFLLVFVTLTVGIAAFEPRRRTARVAPVLIFATFATILLAQYRSLLVTTVVAIVAVTLLLGARGRGFLVVGSAAIGFVFVFHVVATSLPVLKLDSAASSLARNPGEYVRGRARIAENVSRLYGDLPGAIVIGTGPGTYSSRAWQTFANANSTSRSNVAGSYVARLTQAKPYTTDVAEKYVVPQLRSGPIVEGSRAVSSPYSSYTSLLAEVGVLGFVLIALVYLGAAGRAWRMARSTFAAHVQGDPLPAVLLATAIAFLTLLQMAFLENWLEVTRVTFVAWALLAVSAKELDARGVS
jgi:transcriptional regulator with XRE-family HTH domain